MEVVCEKHVTCRELIVRYSADDACGHLAALAVLRSCCALCHERARQLAISTHAAKRLASGVDGHIRARWLDFSLDVELPFFRLRLHAWAGMVIRSSLFHIALRPLFEI